MNKYQSSYHAIDTGTKLTSNRLRLLGILWIIIGVSAMAAAIVATLATMLIFGVLLLLAGTVQLGYAYIQPASDRSWQIATGILYFLVGLLLVIDPVSGAIGLTLLIAILFFVRGVMQLALSAARQRRGQSRGWHLVGGMFSLLLAALIVAGWPETGTWVIGLFVGIELLLGGITMLMTPELVEQKM